MNKEELVRRVALKIADIPASNPGYISGVQEDLSMVLSGTLIRKIAEVAVEEVMVHDRTPL